MRTRRLSTSTLTWGACAARCRGLSTTSRTTFRNLYPALPKVTEERRTMPRLHAIRSFYDQRLGLVTLEDDVLSVVRQVRELYGGRVFVLLDEITGAYHLVENSAEGTERLIF